MSASGWGQRGRWAAPAGYSAVLALLIVGPLLRPGYLLLRDAVSTPRSYLTDSALGLGDAAPRAVPQDALLAVLSPVVDGGVIVKAILVFALWAAGYGAAVLARELLGAPVAGQLVACTVAVWNPYVAERLLQGHWSLLAGYAALPWVVLGAWRIRMTANRGDGWRETVGTWAGLAGSFAAAGLTPTGALLAGITALALLGWRRFAGATALLVVASAPWLIATALSGAGSEPSDPAGIAAFAARAEPWLGTLGSLAGLGGIWNGDAVPDSRTTLLAVLGTVLLLVIVATGLRTVLTTTGRDTTADRDATADRDTAADRATSGATTTPTDSQRVRRTLVALGALAVLLPALGATPWGMHVLEWLVAHVPGAGLLRDTQKYVALAMPAYALCAAAGCMALAQRFSGIGVDRSTNNRYLEEAGKADPSPVVTQHRSSASRWFATIFIAALVLPLLDLAWGVGGAVRAVRYPAGWERVAEEVAEPGDIAVLPGGMFRKFRYSGKAPVLDPAPRMLPRDVLQTGELPVRGRTVAGEGARARTVEDLLLHGGSAQDLARNGVGWVLLEHGTPGPLGESKATLAQLDQAYSDADLTLYRVPGSIDAHSTSPTYRRLSAVAHALWAALLIGGALTAVTMRRTGSRTRT
ncbi:hypothetical protein [Nocardia sp. NPDC049149]|uniref:hypothetical protein n=1 Tax=Nocardia sp. NPDC049149 TaxID=3364315 RepID=UPI00371C2C37